MRVVKLKDCCIIKPPKAEAKKLLNETDMVSFVPMNNLGINRKDLVLDEQKPLSQVTGSYTYFADNDVLLAKITPCFENGKLGIMRPLMVLVLVLVNLLYLGPIKNCLRNICTIFCLGPFFGKKVQL